MPHCKQFTLQPANRAWVLPCVLLLALSALFSSTSAAQTASDAINEQPAAKLSDTPSGRSHTPQQVLDGTATLIGRYQPQNKIRLVLGLTPPKMAEEEEFLKELQDPKSPNFQKYLSQEQWNARFAPSAQDEQAVADWAVSNGLTVTKRYPNRLIVDVEGTSETIEKVFAISINQYQVGGNTEFSNDRDPVIPANLAGILHSVGGLNSIQRARALHQGNARELSKDYVDGAVIAAGASGQHDGNRNAFEEALKISEAKKAEQSQSLKGLASNGPVSPSVTSGFIDPTDIYSSYGYDYGALQAQGHCCNPTHASAGTPPATSIAVATAFAFQGSDIAGFQSRYNYLAYHYQPIYVDGTPACCNDETTLDTEWSIATANSFGSYIDTSEVFVYEGANNLLSTFTDVYNAILDRNETRVFTTSWGCAEFTCIDSGTMDTDHAIFNSMIGQGWTLMAATGDQGSAAGCSNVQAIQYPSSDPDIVAVGGTTLSLYSDGSLFSETGWQGSTYAGACSQNNGGSTGGCSGKFAAPGYQTSPFCGSGSRSVPDISLNAGAGQNTYFNGSWNGFGGTSIASPMVAGFFAQANAYLTSLGLAYTVVGQGGPKIYYFAHNPTYASHVPFYDMTSGCNNNDITALYGLGYYCAVAGYDRVTGWGSFNALQMSWAMNAWFLGDFVAPTVTFSGPPITQGSSNWYNTDQTVSWTVTDNTASGLTATGVSGFSQAWDASFTDPNSEAHGGIGNSFYSGPEFPNATSGFLDLASAGQGCHFATVNAWDNSGYTSGNQYYYYLCYDTIVPTVNSTSSPAANGNGYNKTAVQTSLSATDPGTGASGIKKTYYLIDSAACSPTTLGSCLTYSAPFTISATGTHTFTYFTEDVAGNFSAVQGRHVSIDEAPPVTTAALSGTLSSGTTYKTAVKVTLSATDNFSGIGSSTYSIDGAASVTYSAPFTISTLGAHTVKYFSTDKAGNVETSKAVSFSISSPTTTTLTPSPNPAVVGQTVTLTAKVIPSLSGTPTGTVTFKNGATTLGTATLSAGTAKITTSALPFGTNSLTASYSGAATFLISTSAAISEDIEQKTTTTVTSSLNPSLFGQAVVLTATVKPATSGTPAGTVQFFNDGTSLGTATLSAGKAALNVTGLSAKAHSITATYSGSSSYQTSTSSALTQTVNKATTTTALTSSLNPSAYNESVTFKATVAPKFGGTASGTVTFKDGSTVLGASALAGNVATLTLSNLGVGTSSITATYSGSTSYQTSTSSALTQTVNKATTTATLTSSLNPSKYGQSVTFKATVAPKFGGMAPGTVTFLHGSTVLGTATLSSNVATLKLSNLGVGATSITASYSGSTDFVGSTSSTVAQVVNKTTTATTLKSSANPSNHGSSVTFTATVTPASGPAPVGVATFKDGSTTLGAVALNGSGVATFSTSSLSVGTHSITAVYGGNTTALTSTSSALSQVVH